MDSSLPEYISVIKTITYTVRDVYKDIVQDNSINGEETDEVGIEEIIERIEQYAQDDFSCGWGHEVNIKDLIFLDENGNEL